MKLEEIGTLIGTMAAATSQIARAVGDLAAEQIDDAKRQGIAEEMRRLHEDLEERIDGLLSAAEARSR